MFNAGPFGKNKAKGGPRQFLTQRAIQSFMYLLSTQRDPHTINYLEDFLQTPNLLDFHGTGALNTTIFPTWESLFLKLMEEPKSDIVVKVRRQGRRSRRGFLVGNDHLSLANATLPPENPYLQEKFEEYTIEVDPMNLVRRIMSVREQIAEEFTYDLDVVQIASTLTFKNYQESIRRARDGESSDRCKPAELSEYCDVSSEPVVEDENTNLSMVFGDEAGYRASSPLRRANLDLLQLICTQEAIHRVLCSCKGDEAERSQFEYLRDFYSERLSYFDGNVEHGRHERFMKELMTAPPKIVTSRGLTSKKSKNMQMVDPLRLAEEILLTRSRVAEEWKLEVFHDVASEHNVALYRVMLDKRLMKSDEDDELKEQEDSLPIEVLNRKKNLTGVSDAFQ
eukprot:CAMPEP_0116021432 /NCGR_PEP_ID=MMETSP0321-20121206/10383_1 /TAXON_ID=163516 /ORGANISM="Leptocylindrus danicus var. danicus, Strain B650" /LENGTH=394 /DNA_ID=CAMNT_0003492301 /DNA_START=380 /DNA_END=1564 /DNA_ORIENTATION=-